MHLCALTVEDRTKDDQAESNVGGVHESGAKDREACDDVNKERGMAYLDGLNVAGQGLIGP